jgi:Protein of unknown function (DUF2510)
VSDRVLAPPPEMPIRPADWYPDPEGIGQNRYWDGTKWTDRYAVKAAEQAKTAGRNVGSNTHLLYVLAVLLPGVGLIVGIILLAKHERRRGLAVLLTSIARVGHHRGRRSGCC